MFKIEYLDKTTGTYIHSGWKKKHNKAVEYSEELNRKGFTTRVIYKGKIIHMGTHD